MGTQRGHRTGEVPKWQVWGASAPQSRWGGPPSVNNRWETCLKLKNAISAKKKNRKMCLKVNEKPYLRTRIWIGVSVSQWETEHFSKNSCPCVGETEDCVFWHDKKKIVCSRIVTKPIGKVTNPVRWKTRENYALEHDFMTDVRLAYTRATILTAVLKSEKDEKVKQRWTFDQKRAWARMGPQVLQNKESGERPLRPKRGRSRIRFEKGPKITSFILQK